MNISKPELVAWCLLTVGLIAVGHWLFVLPVLLAALGLRGVVAFMTGR